MLRLGDRIRFTREEIASFQRLGIDLARVRSEADLARALVRWLRIVGAARPDVLEKILAAARRDPILKKRIPRAEIVPLYPPQDRE
ncbi:MAG: hypothetical protein D6771_07720 [Zetaproteobacteria bacterium]|nr:MAG: hypothetical protein D6771_07720 [Zetaproteobacteria bacterium]